jgi:hypothetical protein
MILFYQYTTTEVTRPYIGLWIFEYCGELLHRVKQRASTFIAIAPPVAGCAVLPELMDTTDMNTCHAVADDGLNWVLVTIREDTGSASFVFAPVTSNLPKSSIPRGSAMKRYGG